MLSRARLLLSPAGSGGSSGIGDYHTVPKIADEFQHVLLRNRWAFDHVAIDIGYLSAVAGRFTRDLIGSDRDTEAVKIVHKQVQNQILRRLGGNKSLALMQDGTEPLWKVQHMRQHPGRKFPEKFYRSAASPMVYLLEEKLRTLGPEVKPAPSEFIVSGPGVPGPAEGKMSAWALDLATRIPRSATNPPGAAAITPDDSLCFVGNTDLFLNVLGATPFHNVTAVTFNAGEIKSLSLKECLAWLGLGELLDGASLAAAARSLSSRSSPLSQQQQQQQQPASDDKDAFQVQQQQRLAAVRTDVVLLYLMAHGTSSTNLSPFGVTFADLMDGYRAELAGYTPSTTSGPRTDNGSGTESTESRFFSGLLFDEYPLVSSTSSSTTSGAEPQPQRNTPKASLRLKPEAFARVLTRAAKRAVTFPSRHCPHSANYLEVLLQTHAMLTSGGIQHYGWVPPDAADSVPEKPPKVALDQFIGHLRAAAATGQGTVTPARSRSFALTGLESLLLTSPEAAIVDQVVPMYARGHTLPQGVAQDIVGTKNIFTALDKTRAVLSGLVASETASAKPHPAITHVPSHYLVKAPGARGPPAGWHYHCINLGLKAEAMNIRYSLNASDSAITRDLTESAAESGVSKRNHLHIFDAETTCWRDVPCEQLSSAPATPVNTLRVLTWNVQFDRHSGERTPLGRDGIDWCTRTRYLALAKVLAEADADVIAMQEVEPAWCAHLAEQPWVREKYAMSALPHSHVIAPWGVLLLVRRDLSVTAMTHANVPAFSGHTSAMPEVTLSLGADVPTVTIGSMHLLAPYSQNNVSNRETQLANLVKHLQPTNGSSSSQARILMGDFNDYPTKLFRLPPDMGYHDAWQAIHPRCDDIPPPPPRPSPVPASSSDNGSHHASPPESAEDAEERGYTINGLANPYAARIIEPEFFGRADRIIYRAKRLQPVHAELVGTTPVPLVLPEATHLVERPQEKIPDYLFPSDHFGVLVEFQVV